MKHFIGGFAIGLFIMLVRLDGKDWHGWYEFSASLAAIAIVGSIFGAIAWGLLP